MRSTRRTMLTNIRGKKSIIATKFQVSAPGQSFVLTFGKFCKTTTGQVRL